MNFARGVDPAHGRHFLVHEDDFEFSAFDRGDGFASGQPNATVKVANHEAPLWLVEARNKAVFAGEVAGSWLWLVLWPDTAGVLLFEPLSLRDLRDPDQDLDVPFGALSPRLPA